MRPCGLRAEGCGDRPKMSWQEDRKVGEKRGSRQGQGAGGRASWCVWVGPRCAHLGVKQDFLCCLS